MNKFIPITAIFTALLIVVNVWFFQFDSQAQTTESSESTPEITSEANPETQSIIIDGREAEGLWIVTGQGRFRFTVEVADDENERSKGLMFRETMAPTHGMLFDFERTENVQMWMRNTPLSLDMLFVDDQGMVITIAERTTPFSDAIIDSIKPVSHVLEINAGISKLIGLKAGDQLIHSKFPKSKNEN